ncbi:putative NuA3 HAT complex component NTO1 [Glarea lozoyensis 74030]|uniref:Putative NuA3 HAT complex component NTO1 n=1 Tax=Glarea lozoyensis (strain ATCC 74030 / MF5533) TaxID=1104152 RepID=H0EFW6_GLAL7|nr:putative NuA3 HAT complex component NTO1 [Glarea lozoyensis 74030]
MVALGSGGVGRVEYDMDEQDDKWLQEYNKGRKAINHEAITREIFEITMTKIEKEWHALEKRIPKPNPKPPQTHRPRSSSAAAVNGEPQAGEEPDSKCAICDDGDCENTNAIVFCDGCDLAVHQECYGVPFIPEGQWMCRKCLLIGRGIPTCIFCPNTDGGFKKTNASKWAHLLCAMWIPEVSLVTEHQPDESQLTGAKMALALGDSKKRGAQPAKAVWKLPSGAPVIPQVVYNSVESSLQRFNIRKRKEYAADACRYWTLKREARRGAALLKRLQLQMETFSSMEITRRNFAGMGHAGRPKLNRRIEFAGTLVKDLERLTTLVEDVKKRELEKLTAVELEEDAVDTIYFPVAQLFPPMVARALTLDTKIVFHDGLKLLEQRVQNRFYTTATAFAQDFGNVFHNGIVSQPVPQPEQPVSSELKKPIVTDIRERRRLAKRIIKTIQPQLQAAVRAEADISGKSAEILSQSETLVLRWI